MKNLLAVAMAGWFLWASAGANHSARAADQGAPLLPRIEARSASVLVVGVVHGDTMTLRVSRLVDNAPVHDLTVDVLLRGESHTTTAQPDGSYSLTTEDLKLPGAASVQFTVTEAAAARPQGGVQQPGSVPAQGAISEKATGTLQIGSESAKNSDQSGARQLWWWVLNFAVCIGFLVLISRRKKAATPES
jgi:hypothetical protein